MLCAVRCGTRRCRRRRRRVRRSRHSTVRSVRPTATRSAGLASGECVSCSWGSPASRTAMRSSTGTATMTPSSSKHRPARRRAARLRSWRTAGTTLEARRSPPPRRGSRRARRGSRAAGRGDGRPRRRPRGRGSRSPACSARRPALACWIHAVVERRHHLARPRARTGRPSEPSWRLVSTSTSWMPLALASVNTGPRCVTAIGSSPENAG